MNIIEKIGELKSIQNQLIEKKHRLIVDQDRNKTNHKEEIKSIEIIFIKNTNELLSLYKERYDSRHKDEVEKMDVKKIRKEYRQQYNEFIIERRATAEKLKSMVQTGKDMRAVLDKLNTLVKKETLSEEDKYYINHNVTVREKAEETETGHPVDDEEPVEE